MTRELERRPLRIAMIGTRGVPARYGGFETCVEEVGTRLVSAGHQVVVYCRSTEEKPETWKGMELVHLPALRRRTLETLSHTGLSVAHVLFHRVDAAIVFNAANSPWLPILRAAGIPVATHVDGLEWKRAKWGPAGRKYYRAAEALSVRWSDALIADAPGIQDYYRAEFGVDTQLIRYGAPIIAARNPDRVAELGLNPGGYHLVVARFEPENHVDMIVDGYVRSSATLPLVVVGHAPYADEYTRRVHELADDRVRFLGGVWDQDLLDQLYANAAVYWHGHSVGGTNPSLLRAIGAGAAVNAFDVNFNRGVLGDAGEYFGDADQVAFQTKTAETFQESTRVRGDRTRSIARNYDWGQVANAYEDLSYGLADGTLSSDGATGRRRAPRPKRAASGASEQSVRA